MTDTEYKTAILKYFTFLALKEDKQIKKIPQEIYADYLRVEIYYLMDKLKI